MRLTAQSTSFNKKVASFDSAPSNHSFRKASLSTSFGSNAFFSSTVEIDLILPGRSYIFFNSPIRPIKFATME